MKSSETDGQDASASAFMVRWRRPEFHNPDRSAIQTAQQGAPKAPGRQADLALEAAPLVGSKAPQATPWPARLPDQVRAVAVVISSAAVPLALADIESRFKGRGPWKRSLPRILETLEALGRARKEEVGGKILWRG